MHKPTHANYYEAIIQLRPGSKEVLSFIVQEIEQRKGVFIAKTEELKTGIDIYISSQQFARSLGKKLKEHFNGTVTISRKLHKRDRQTSKLLYRATVLFRQKE